VFYAFILWGSGLSDSFVFDVMMYGSLEATDVAAYSAG
jgi:hypothetical protein